MIKIRKITTKITLLIIIGLVISFLILTTVITVGTANQVIKDQNDKLMLIAKENATMAKDMMETMINKQSIIINAIESINVLSESESYEYLNNLIKTAKNQEEDILSLYYVLESNDEYKDGITISATSGETKVYNNSTQFIDGASYSTIKSNKNLMIVDPHKKTIDGKEYLVISVLQPILDKNNNLRGVVGSDIDVSLINNIKYNNGGYESFSNNIVCAHETVIMHTMLPDSVGSKYVDVSRSTNPSRILDSTKTTETDIFVDEFKDGSKQYVAAYPFTLGTSTTPWLSCSSALESEFLAPVNSQVLLILIICFASLIILTFSTNFVVKKYLKPLKQIENATHSLANGILSLNILYDKDDEIGSLGRSLKKAVNEVSDYITDIDLTMDTMSRGNFDVKPAKPFIGDFKNIEDSITRFVVTMSRTIETINNSADQVAFGAEQVSTSTQILAQGSQEQASSLEEISASIQEISHNVQNNAENAVVAQQKANQAGQDIMQSNIKMKEMVTAINEINNKSTQISKIIKTIEDIAFKTNILALNAAVEAARAGGTAGKGFAVVASEVRTLSAQSAEAAKNTTVLIGETIKAVENGTKIANETANSMDEVIESTTAATQLIDKVTIASSEQAVSLNQATIGISQISSVVQTSSATVEEAASASTEMSSQSKILKQATNKFQINKDLLNLKID